MRKSRLKVASLIMACLPAVGASAATTFYHGFNQVVGQGAGTADSAAGNPNQQIGPPNGPGGEINATSPYAGAASLLRSNGSTIGGMVEYQTAANWNSAVGTIQMWVRGDGVTGGGFVGLWGTDTSSGSGDIRMYIYDTGAGRTLGAYMLGGTNGATFWEIEQAIPVANLDTTNWHNVIWQYDTTAGKTATWWDGQLLRNTPDAGVVNYHAPSNTLFHVGANQAGSANFPGYIDEFYISDTPLYDWNSNVPEPGTASFLVLAGIGLLARKRST